MRQHPLSSSILLICFCIFLCTHSLNAFSYADSELNKKLLEASSNSEISLINSHLKQGANPNYVGEFGVTPLMKAAGLGDVAAMELLLKHGAKVTTKDLGGATALHYAVRSKSPDAIDLLILHGADLNEKSSIGFSAKDMAINMKVPINEGMMLQEHPEKENEQEEFAGLESLNFYKVNILNFEDEEDMYFVFNACMEDDLLSDKDFSIYSDKYGNSIFSISRFKGIKSAYHTCAQIESNGKFSCIIEEL